MRAIEKTNRNREAAIEEALRELGVSRDQAVIEILEEEKEGILGIFGARPAKVRVTVKEDKRELARELLEKILGHMNVPCSVKLEKSEDATAAVLLIDGESVGNVIGKRGSTLNSIQYLLNVMVNKEGSDKINVSIDASGYRESRVKSLEELSLKLAQKVRETKKSLELEPMTSQERKVIHMTLKNNADVYTYSKGEEPFRKVVISAKNKERSGKPQRPPRERSAEPRPERDPNRRKEGNRPHGDRDGQKRQQGGGQQKSPEPTVRLGNTALKNIINSNNESRILNGGVENPPRN